MHPMLNIAIKAARRAGTIINRASMDLERLSVARKGPRDYVTEVDRAAEESIVETLRAAYPDHAVLGEEFGLQGPDQAEFQWIIDPLDGTTNFIHGLPNYAVSIALTQRGQVTQAVIYDPSRNELFTASRGSGTFLNDRRVRVSGRTRYHEALLGAHWPNSGDLEQGSQRFRAMAEGSTGVRRLGATVLDLAYVACGRLDGFCGVGLKPRARPDAFPKPAHVAGFFVARAVAHPSAAHASAQFRKPSARPLSPACHAFSGYDYRSCNFWSS